MQIESHETRNNVIMMSLPKTMETMGKCGSRRNQAKYIYRWKGFDGAIQKCNFY